MNAVDDAHHDATERANSDRLSAAYEERADMLAPQRSLRMELWILLGLLALNTTLWLLYTRNHNVWGHNNETAVQANLAEHKITLTAPSKLKEVNDVKASITTAEPPATAAVPASPTPVLATVVSDKGACMLWAFTNAAESSRASTRLAEQGWSGYSTDVGSEAPTYMAFIGPFSSPQQTDHLIKNLIKLKVKDYSLLPSGSIALGVVATREAGQQLQQQLTHKGLKGVQLIERQGKNKLNRYRFEQMAPTSLAALKQLSQGLGTLTECSK